MQALSLDTVPTIQERRLFFDGRHYLTVLHKVGTTYYISYSNKTVRFYFREGIKYTENLPFD